ncbi:MAG: tRNA(Met) cytidine acetyltransferase TmcA domain-containing protein, partial [Candidatus Njordarchaeota archaeon]
MNRHSDLLEAVFNALSSAKESFERRLFIVIGGLDKTENAMIEILENMQIDSILVTSNFKKFRNRIGQVLDNNATTISCWDTDKILGRTYNIAIIDLRDWPDVIALSRATGTVRGGGIIFVMLPFDYKTKTYYQEIVPPFCKKQPRKIMLERIIKKSVKHEGVYVYDADKEIFIWKPKEKARRYERKKIEVPKDVLIPKKIYELVASQDQINVLKAFENWQEYIILLANRGRGKSASIGLGLTGYATLFAKKHKRAFFVCLTSRSILNVEEIFR